MPMVKARENAGNGNSISKLPPVPKGYKIQKRPLTRSPLPSSSKAPVIYMSSKTPFMSAVSRIRKQLDKPIRSLGGAAPARKNATLHSRVEALKQAGSGDTNGVVVTIMGTGKAIEKTLSVASWFQQQVDCKVQLRTKTVAAVDDVVASDTGDGDCGEEEESRVRQISCLEVQVSLK